MLLFWVGFLLLAHTYVIYPWHMRRLARRITHWSKPEPFTPVPKISILLAAYNEEAVIEEKIRTTLHTDFPAQQLELLIGTDHCSDNTDLLVKAWAKKDPRVRHFPFAQRQGKPSILNQLVPYASGEILVLTDADTYFLPDTLPHLIAPFLADPHIGGVQSAFQTKTEGGNVGMQESLYNDREMVLKAGESSQGAVIGAYGSGYAIRKSYYQPVPPGFVVDDFFLFMEILKQKKKCVLAPSAITQLQVSGDSQVQYQRKVRISRGNWMNLIHFLSLLSPKHGFIAYAFWSHKVLRWVGPWLLLMMFLGAAYSAPSSTWMRFAFYGQVLFYAIALFDGALNQFGLSNQWLRFIRHFVWMNIALLHGFGQFLFGKKEAWWNK